MRLVLAVGLLAMLASAAPAAAMEPGQNGRLAFTSDRDGDFDVYTMEPSGAGLSQVTSHADRDGEPRWSSTGKQLIFFAPTSHRPSGCQP